jgi:hypothetical protein
MDHKVAEKSLDLLKRKETKEEVKKEEVKEEPEYARILRECGGIESNVPLNSPYWTLRP